MYSESESVRQTFGYPSPQMGSSACNNISGKQLNRRARDRKSSIKDQLFFKLKVLKRVGQLVSNLKSSVALLSHGLNEQQLSYLQNSQQHSQSERLLRQDNLLLLAVESLLWILLWVNLWRCSFEMVFEKLQEDFIINAASILVYICYLVVYFNSMVRNQRQELITLRSAIALKYFKHRFPQVLPFFLTIIVELAFEPPQQSPFYYLIRIIPITILPEISIIYKSLQHAISSEDRGEIIIMFAKLLGKIFLFLHVIALLLNAARNLQMRMGYQMNWVDRYGNGQKFDSGELYLLAWYWGTTILCTVGFGQIVPVNNLQRGLVSFLELFSALIFGYFVNYIGSLIKMQAEKTDMFEINLRRLNRYLSKANVPRALKKQARAHYFDREETVKIYNQEQEEHVLSNLNSNIKKDILEFSNLEILKATSLSNFMDLDLLKQIIHKMHKLVYAPEQTIYSPEDKDARKLWIIEKGKVVDKWSNGSGKQSKNIAVYTSKAHENVLGWVNFIKQQAYRLSAKCQAFSILHEIDRQDFFNILKENRKCFLKLMEQRDQMIFAGKKYVSQCNCCDSLSHSTVNCPKIHFPKRSAEFLFARSQYQILFSKKCKRSKRGRNSTRINWHRSIDNLQQIDPVASRAQLAQHDESKQSFLLLPINNSKKNLQQIKRASVDQVMEYKKGSIRLIEKDDLNSSKRLSSKKELVTPQLVSNKIITKQSMEEEIMNNFDKMLTDQSGYFEEWHFLKVLQRKSEVKVERRKKKAVIIHKS